MYKLLIVEDERWEREGLIDFLDWSAMGIEIAGSARDGVEGLKQTLELNPDIVITDIGMPGMDGLEMSKKIKELRPYTRIIILTGYGDFEFARTAIELKASHYVLKPVNEEQLTEAIKKVLYECEQDSSARQETEKLRAEVAEQRRLMKRSWIHDLLSGSLDPKYVKELMREEGFEPDAEGYMAFVFKHPHTNRFETSLGGAIPVPHIMTYSNKEEVEWVVILSIQEQSPEQAALALLNHIAVQSGLIWPAKLTIGAGASVPSLDRVHESLKQAGGLLMYAVFWGESGIIMQEQVESEHTAFLNGAAEFLHKGGQLIKAVVYGVQTLELEKAQTSAIALFDYIQGRRGADGDYIRHYVGGLLFELSVLAGVHLNSEGAQADPDDHLYALHSILSIKEYTLGYIETTITSLRNKRDGKEEYIVRQVNRLIEQNYSSPDVSLKSIAEEVFLSPNYLGSLYKKTTGKPLHDQLAQIRMNKAQELLAMPHYKVARVAQEVGIPSASYFCTIFKGVFGITPREYQETLHRK